MMRPEGGYTRGHPSLVLLRGLLMEARHRPPRINLFFCSSRKTNLIGPRRTDDRLDHLIILRGPQRAQLLFLFLKECLKALYIQGPL